MEVSLFLFALCAMGTMNALAKPVEDANSLFRYDFAFLHREPQLGDFMGNARTENLVETKWIEQKLDNFDENITDTWQMRYISNSAYYVTGGPLFIYVGGPWTIGESGVTRGHTVDMAKKHKGYIFYTEHRYYGESNPTVDLSVDNMKYLNVRQALADLAHFVRTMKSTIPGAENSKVIMSGGVSAGSMTTWFAKLYPELVTGSWSSSGPLLAKTNFIEYNEVVGQSISEVGGKQCHDRIQNSIEQLQKLLKDNRIAEVKAIFKLCNNFNENNDMDVGFFFFLISDVISHIVVVDNPGDIENMCSYFDDATDDYINLANFIVEQLALQTCKDMTYKNSLLEFMNTSSIGNGIRQWAYQTCTEFGWYQSSESKQQPFGNMFPIEYFIARCGDIFGKEFTRTFIDKQVEKTNLMFGGLNPGVERIYSTQGSLDPWKAVGITNNTVVIPMASLSMDLGSVSANDTPFLRAAKNKISELVEKWLQEG